MTNKQIIIDGVDVSECEHNADKLCSMSLEACCYCSAKPNCIYKRFKRKEQECERLKFNNDYKVGALETTIDNLKAELAQEQTLKEMYFTYYKAKHEDIKGEFFKLRNENEKLKETLKVIASRSCLNLYDCTGHCLPNCKWNAHVLAQQTLKEIISEVEE